MLNNSIVHLADCTGRTFGSACITPLAYTLILNFQVVGIGGFSATVQMDADSARALGAELIGHADAMQATSEGGAA